MFDFTLYFVNWFSRCFITVSLRLPLIVLGHTVFHLGFKKSGSMFFKFVKVGTSSEVDVTNCLSKAAISEIPMHSTFSLVSLLSQDDSLYILLCSSM